MAWHDRMWPWAGKTLRRRWAVGLLIVGCLFAGGWISNRMTAYRCELFVANTIISDHYQGSTNVWCRGWRSQVDPASLFPPATILFREMEPRMWPQKGDLSFWVDAAACWLPFVIRVDYTWSTGKLAGEFDRAWFACLFGRYYYLGYTCLLSY